MQNMLINNFSDKHKKPELFLAKKTIRIKLVVIQIVFIILENLSSHRY